MTLKYIYEEVVRRVNKENKISLRIMPSYNPYPKNTIFKYY